MKSALFSFAALFVACQVAVLSATPVPRARPLIQKATAGLAVGSLTNYGIGFAGKALPKSVQDSWAFGALKGVGSAAAGWHAFNKVGNARPESSPQQQVVDGLADAVCVMADATGQCIRVGQAAYYSQRYHERNPTQPVPSIEKFKDETRKKATWFNEYFFPLAPDTVGSATNGAPPSYGTPGSSSSYGTAGPSNYQNYGRRPTSRQ